MTITINSQPNLGFSGATAAHQPREFKTSTYDEDWAENVDLLADEEFMERFRSGVAQLQRGALRSFKDVFGEPL
jgi:hypothetical protein